MNLKPRLDLLALVLMAAVSLALVTACDTEEALTWVNETDVTVGIYIGDDIDDFDLSVSPHSTESRGMISDLWEDVIVVRGEDGKVLYRKEITWDELEAQGFTFVIRQEDIAGGAD